jgi:uncharacterized protein YjbI with pentapeptide repeats
MSDEPRRPRSWRQAAAPYSKWARPLIALEWVTEWVVFYFRRWALVDLLQILGSFTLLAALISYCRGADDRQRALLDQRRARQYQAWQAISAAQGKPGNGGRIQALQDLANDSVSLSGIDVTGAWLRELSLRGANLDRMRGNSADLSGADLRLTSLRFASLDSVHLPYADLRGADLRGASLVGAILGAACLNGANLEGADLRGANLNGASLDAVHLSTADLRETSLFGVHLNNADLDWVDLRHAIVPRRIADARTVTGANVDSVYFESVDSVYPTFSEDSGIVQTLIRRGAVRWSTVSEAEGTRDTIRVRLLFDEFAPHPALATATKSMPRNFIPCGPSKMKLFRVP